MVVLEGTLFCREASRERQWISEESLDIKVRGGLVRTGGRAVMPLS